jgi:hypothetical protein
MVLRLPRLFLVALERKIALRWIIIENKIAVVYRMSGSCVIAQGGRPTILKLAMLPRQCTLFLDLPFTAGRDSKEGEYLIFILFPFLNRREDGCVATCWRPRLSPWRVLKTRM